MAYIPIGSSSLSLSVSMYAILYDWPTGGGGGGGGGHSTYYFMTGLLGGGGGRGGGGILQPITCTSGSTSLASYSNLCQKFFSSQKTLTYRSPMGE